MTYVLSCVSIFSTSPVPANWTIASQSVIHIAVCKLFILQTGLAVLLLLVNNTLNFKSKHQHDSTSINVNHIYTHIKPAKILIYTFHKNDKLSDILVVFYVQSQVLTTSSITYATYAYITVQQISNYKTARSRPKTVYRIYSNFRFIKKKKHHHLRTFNMEMLQQWTTAFWSLRGFKPQECE